MNKNNINSLYALIKEQVKLKGCPLKIICDWDETFQPLSPAVWYLIAKEKGWYDEKLPDFKVWFQHFWENCEIEFTKRGKHADEIETGYSFSKWLKGKSKQEIREIAEKDFLHILGDPKFHEQTPLLSIAEELLEAMKDNLISSLIFFTASNNQGKRKKLENSIGLFPNTQLTLQKMGRLSQRGEYRWQWAKKNHPDFDIYIDDNPLIMSQNIENLPKDKIFVLPNYKMNRHVKGKNVYHVKQEISNIRDQDFAKAAKEYKEKFVTNKNKQINGKSVLLWSGFIVLVLCGLGLAYVLLKRIKKRR